MQYAFMPMQTFPGGVSGIYEVMRFTLLLCDALRPSDEIQPSEQSEGAGHVLRRTESSPADPAPQTYSPLLSRPGSLFDFAPRRLSPLGACAALGSPAARLLLCGLRGRPPACAGAHQEPARLLVSAAPCAADGSSRLRTAAAR